MPENEPTFKSDSYDEKNSDLKETAPQAAELKDLGDVLMADEQTEPLESSRGDRAPDQTTRKGLLTAFKQRFSQMERPRKFSFSKKQPAENESLHWEERFVIATVTIQDKKDIEGFILNKALKVLDDPDFYYGYILTGNSLSMVAVKSAKHIVGGLSIFAPAFLTEGKFFWYEDDSKSYHFITSKEGIIKHELGYQPREEYTPLSADAEILAGVSIPKSLRFRWSLSRKETNLTASLVLVMAVAVIMLGISLYDFDKGRREQFRQAHMVKKPNFTRGLPNVFGPTWTVANKIQGKGIIHLISINDGTKREVTFNIKFPNPVDTQGFIAQNPTAQVHNDMVVYTMPMQ
ncbi:MAG: hypothetical protein M1353_07845 [Nitrospirae bacterium]|nr:hypothetical protein [Nitrospirota bacterium]